jgi:hypothetical protein
MTEVVLYEQRVDACKVPRRRANGHRRVADERIEQGQVGREAWCHLLALVAPQRDVKDRVFDGRAAQTRQSTPRLR